MTIGRRCGFLDIFEWQEVEVLKLWSLCIEVLTPNKKMAGGLVAYAESVIKIDSRVGDSSYKKSTSQ